MSNDMIGLASTLGLMFAGWVVKNILEIAPLKENVKELKEDTTYIRDRVDALHDRLQNRP
jgi:hypothetical protein